MGSGAQWALAMTARNFAGTIDLSALMMENAHHARAVGGPLGEGARHAALAGPVIAAVGSPGTCLPARGLAGRLSACGCWSTQTRAPVRLCDRTGGSKIMARAKIARPARRRASLEPVVSPAETSRQKIGHDSRVPSQGGLGVGVAPPPVLSRR